MNAILKLRYSQVTRNLCQGKNAPDLNLKNVGERACFRTHNKVIANGSHTCKTHPRIRQQSSASCHNATSLKIDKQIKITTSVPAVPHSLKCYSPTELWSFVYNKVSTKLDSICYMQSNANGFVSTLYRSLF